MPIQFDRKKYEAVATVVELRHIAADVKRLNDLEDNRLVVEQRELALCVPAAITDLDEKLVAWNEAQAAIREAAAKAAKEGDALVDGKPKAAAKKKATKKKAAKKKAASK